MISCQSLRVLGLIVCLLIIARNVSGQSGNFPPKNFTATKNYCDSAEWKLVLYDEFDEPSLKEPWISYNTWLGMPIPDDENWPEARCVLPYTAIYKDNNIEISNGTLKLHIKKENEQWQCDTCKTNTYKTEYTAATIATPYAKYFNSGKIEARLKMPTFRNAHCTFWTWMGNVVNEIDIAEAYGVKENGSLFGDYFRTNYSLHAWEPGQDSIKNPYHLQHIEVRNTYPQQSWWRWLNGQQFRQDDFHTYTCEWDSTRIQFYLDGEIVNTFWKYIQPRELKKNTYNWDRNYKYAIGSDCVIDSGQWFVMPGFPWNNDSRSNLRFTAGLSKSHPSHQDGLLGSIEIDYVKMWQRHLSDQWPVSISEHDNKTGYQLNEGKRVNPLLVILPTYLQEHGSLIYHILFDPVEKNTHSTWELIDANKNIECFNGRKVMSFNEVPLNKIHSFQVKNTNSSQEAFIVHINTHTQKVEIDPKSKGTLDYLIQPIKITKLDEFESKVNHQLKNVVFSNIETVTSISDKISEIEFEVFGEYLDVDNAIKTLNYTSSSLASE